MKIAGRWIAGVALIVGLGGAMAFGGDDPLAPKTLAVTTTGPGAAVSYDAATWTELPADRVWEGLTLLQPTFVKGPARIRVIAGTYIEIPAGTVVRVSWEPAVRAWRFATLVGEATAHFSNICVPIPACQSVSLTSGGDLWRGPGGYGPSRPVGLVGLQEVSGFRPFEDDQR